MLIDQTKIDFLKGTQPLSFEDALYLLRVQKKVRRLDWPTGAYILLKKEMSVVDFQPHFVGADDDNYNISTVDILSEDWMFV